MITKLPKWVWYGAWALAFVAGIVNVVGLLGFQHQPITHLTGTTSMLAVAVGGADIGGVLHFAAILGSFIAGTVICGFLVKHNALELGKSYGYALILESLLLSIAVPLLRDSDSLGIYLASAACGLQNAMVSTYSGTVIRTTHISGMLTDLGIFLGNFLRGLPIDRLRMRLCFLIISAFFSGGVVGTALFRHFEYATLFIPAGLTGLAAIAYGVTSWRR